MSTMSEDARKAAKSKAERLVRADPRERVDASGYMPDGAMNADVAAGMRPVSRRQFRRGGKVAGESAPARADRKPRASGGNVTAYMNRDMKSANEERGGLTHKGGLKRGGRAGKLAGGPLMGATGSASMPPTVMGRATGGKVHKDAAQDRKLIHQMGCKCAKCGGGRVGHAKGGPAINDGTRPVAGRMARKGGGRTKGKTNINIIVAPQGGGAAGARPPMPMPPPAGGPVGLHQGAPPPPPVMAGAPAPAMPMGRKAGGRTLEKDGGKLLKPGKYPLDVGAGSGLGRLEKAKAARP